MRLTTCLLNSILLLTALALAGCGKESPRATTPKAASDISIFKAAGDGNLAELRRLIAEGADVNKADQYGATPLWFAIQKG